MKKQGQEFLQENFAFVLACGDRIYTTAYNFVVSERLEETTVDLARESASST